MLPHACQLSHIDQETPGFINLLLTLSLFCKISRISNILLSLLYIFSSKPGKISTHNSLASFLKTSSSVVCSEFNHILFTVMVRVKRLIISYFIFFKARLISKQMKYIGSLFILVFVCSQVSTKHFLHVFKNRWRTSLLLLLNPHLLICSTKVCLLVYCTLFYHPP